VDGGGRAGHGTFFLWKKRNLKGYHALMTSSIFFFFYICRPKEVVDLEGEFEPSLLNSGVYLIQLSMQVSTFAINYQVGFRDAKCMSFWRAPFFL
jgi:hypothetical protein